jgi:GMP synthase-like glutamine amidotransferase
MPVIGVLEAGAPPAELADRFDGYPRMAAELLGEGFDIRAYDVRAGELPASPTAHDGWLITGSSNGVYDPEPWIAPLADFVVRAAGQAPMVGICFGHQLMAQAFGGEVVKSPKGWGIGLHEYRIEGTAPWIDDPAPVRLAVSHQDQVVAVGPAAEVIGGSEFTPYGIVAYPKLRAVSIQAHPEFEPDYARALIELRRGKRFDAPFADAALASLSGPNDRRRVGRWLARFLAGK